jgi:hypothetical protein
MAGPGFIPVPNGVRVKFGGVIDTLQWSSRIFAVGSLSPTTTILNDLVAAVVAWSTAHWAPVAAPAATLATIEAQDWSVHLGQKAEGTSTAVGTLSGATGALPSAIAARVDLIPASGGWRHPGSLFHTGIDQVQTAGSDTLTSGAVTAITAAYAALVAGINAAVVPAFDASMVSFRLNKLPRTAGVPFAIINEVTRPKLATQVRRLRSVR